MDDFGTARIVASVAQGEEEGVVRLLGAAAQGRGERCGGASDAGLACHGNAGRGRLGAGIGAEAGSSTVVKSRGPAKEGLCKKGTGSESQQTRDMAT